MSMKSMNIMCFIIILVSTSIFSVVTAVDGYIFKSDAEFFHKLLLVNDATKTDEFSFIICRDPVCNAATRSLLKISFGSAKSGSSLISFKLDIMEISGQGVVTVTSMDSSIVKTAIPPNTLPSEKPAQQHLETTNTGLPEKSASANTTTSSENISIDSTVIFVIFGVVIFLMMILISAVTYFVLSRFSYCKPPENDNTNIDVKIVIRLERVDIMSLITSNIDQKFQNWTVNEKELEGEPKMSTETRNAVIPEKSISKTITPSESISINSTASIKNSDSNISTGLHLCALISIVLIICVTILLLKFGYGIIFLLCFYIMMKSDDKKPIHIHNETNIIVEQNGPYATAAARNVANVSNTNKIWIVNEQQPKRKPMMSKPSSGKKEKEGTPQESHDIQLLSKIYDMTKSLLNDTREIIQKFDQNEGPSKNSTECISTELAALQKQKESQSLVPDNLSPGEAPESLERFQDCINHRNSRVSHSTNTLDSKAGEQIKDNVDVPKEIAPFLKNNSLRRITYHFNEIQSSTASNTINGSNNSTSTLFPIAVIAFLLLTSGNEVTSDKKPIYIHNERNIYHKGDNIGSYVGDGGRNKNSNQGMAINKQNFHNEKNIYHHEGDNMVNNVGGVRNKSNYKNFTSNKQNQQTPMPPSTKNDKDGSQASKLISQ